MEKLEELNYITKEIEQVNQQELQKKLEKK